MSARKEILIDSRAKFGQPQEDQTSDKVLYIDPDTYLPRIGNFDFSEKVTEFHSESARHTRRSERLRRRLLRSPVV